VRDVITGVLTDAKDQDLIKAEGREHLKEDVLKELKKKTDVKVEEVLFADLTVQ
jgi:flagellar FliL protein